MRIRRARYNSDVRRIGRFILNGLTVMSLVLCAATCWLWVRSYSVDDVLYRKQLGQADHPGWEMALGSTRGRLFCSAELVYWGPDRPWQHLTAESGERWAVPDSRFALKVSIAGQPGMVRYNYAIAPHWAVAAFLLAVPLWRLAHRMFRRRPCAGSCPKCGYDLRATPARCPECGWGVEDVHLTDRPVVRPSRGSD
jgi:hypothetical protein